MNSWNSCAEEIDCKFSAALWMHFSGFFSTESESSCLWNGYIYFIFSQNGKKVNNLFKVAAAVFSSQKGENLCIWVFDLFLERAWQFSFICYVKKNVWGVIYRALIRPWWILHGKRGAFHSHFHLLRVYIDFLWLCNGYTFLVFLTEVCKRHFIKIDILRVIQNTFVL